MHDPLLSADEVDDFIIVRVTALVSKIQRKMARDVLRKEQLPVLEWRLLFSVARFGSCHLAHVTRRTSIDPAHGSRAVTALERKGLLRRSDDPHNRRRKVLSLTPEGVKVFNRIWPQAQAITKAVTDQLDREDFARLKVLLDSMHLKAEAMLDGLEPVEGLMAREAEEKADAA